MKMVLCMIVKGDEELDILKRAVASVSACVSGIYITTNAKEYKLTKEWCEGMGYHHSHLPWDDDFSAQRNFNFSQAPDDVDYILWMDSDDVVLGAEGLVEIATNAKHNDIDAVFFDYWYGNRFKGKPTLDNLEKVEIIQSRERILNPRKVKWKGRLHETPIPLDNAELNYTRVKHTEKTPIAWVHMETGTTADQGRLTAHMKRNRKLLELQLKDERAEGKADPRTLLYLMKIYKESDKEEDLQECIEMGREYLSKSGWDAERAVAIVLMAKCMGKLGEERKSRDLLMEAMKEHPYDPAIYLHLAKVSFNLNDYGAMKHWMKIGLSLDVDDERVAMRNLLEMEVLGAQLMLRYYMNAEHDANKAYEAGAMLYKLDPTAENKENLDFLENQKELNNASKSAHGLMLYLENIFEEYRIPDFYTSLPDAMRDLPFATHFYNKHKEPKVWGEKEIVYYASFGQNHFEKWDGNSLKKGIGGSETAVIRLSEEWTKLGYKVTVYCDPPEEKEINGVRYVPHYKFNPRDRFNILITWRHANMAGKVIAKKHYVDLHDLFAQETYFAKADHIDALMVKSEYHRGLAPDIKNVEVISNGI